MADKNFNYPFLEGWSTQDIITVSALYDAVANTYEVGIDRTDLLAAYQAFKEIVPSKAEEKQLDRKFGEDSGYSIYAVIKAAREQQTTRIRMKD